MSGSALILLAAGASRRFGAANKLLAPLDGVPLVAHAAAAARGVAVDHRLAVVSDDAVAAHLAGFALVRVAPGVPQSVSLQAGIAAGAALGADRALIVLGDMPRVQASLMSAVLARGDDAPAAATDGVRLLPPVCLPSALFAAVAGLQGDRGAGALLTDLPQGQRVLAPDAELVDIDLPSDLERLSESRQP